MHMKDEERKRWFQWDHKQTPSSIWEWQEPDFLQERPDTDHIWYTLRKQKFLLWNINKILLNLTYILRNQKQKEISISGNIESVTHIEQLSLTGSLERRDSKNKREDENDTLKCISEPLGYGLKLCIRRISERILKIEESGRNFFPGYFKELQRRKSQ